ncbi:MAG: NUDIX domain-containing protein [Mariprofundaceae bacterium]|nr:NUDIX domain-containing protein [Mariprofundaceae bacterium]
MNILPSMPTIAPKNQSIALVAPFDQADRVLLLKRDADQYQHCGGLWSFPGGKVEVGESVQCAAMRELKEETNLDGTAWQWLCERHFEYPDRALHIHLFRCICSDLKTLKKESTYVWSPLGGLNRYPMPAANDLFVEALQLHSKVVTTQPIA